MRVDTVRRYIVPAAEVLAGLGIERPAGARVTFVTSYGGAPDDTLVIQIIEPLPTAVSGNGGGDRSE